MTTPGITYTAGAPMYRADFKPCANCGKGVAHTGLPLFWRVRIERLAIDRTAVQQQHGLEQFFGGGSPVAVLMADIMGGGRAIANPFSEVSILLCESCITASPVHLAALAEAEQHRVDAKEQERKAAKAAREATEGKGQ